MRRLWSNSGSLLRHLYALDQRLRSPLLSPHSTSLQSGGSFREAYHMFFVQTVLVPPNNVRPLSRMGDMTFEHPQNTALTQASPSLYFYGRQPFMLYLSIVKCQSFQIPALQLSHASIEYDCWPLMFQFSWGLPASAPLKSMCKIAQKYMPCMNGFGNADYQLQPGFSQLGADGPGYQGCQEVWPGGGPCGRGGPGALPPSLAQPAEQSERTL